MYDLLIKNGLVLDGTGGASYPADVAAVGGDIVAIGRLDGEAAKTINAEGLAVSPGFIDLHTHSDMSFLLDPTAQSKVRQGVTLELTGNCGMSFCAPLQGAAMEMLKSRVSMYTDDFNVTWDNFAGYLDALENAGSTLNIAAQIGHHSVRANVVGLEDRPPSRDDLDRMKALVAECLDAGAMGFSTGLYYAPGNYARPEEVMYLAAAAADRSGRFVATDDRGGYEGHHLVHQAQVEQGPQQRLAALNQNAGHGPLAAQEIEKPLEVHRAVGRG